MACARAYHDVVFQHRLFVSFSGVVLRCCFVVSILCDYVRAHHKSSLSLFSVKRSKKKKYCNFNNENTDEKLKLFS